MGSPCLRDVFAASPDVHGTLKSTVSILDLASNKVTSLPGSVGMFSSRWSPDGRRIAAVSFDYLTMKLFDVQTQQWSVVYKGGAAIFPAWSSDSRYIFFLLLSGAGVFRVPITGGNAELIADTKAVTPTGSFGVWFGLDPADTPLLLRDAGTQDIYALSLERQ
jgi:WD40 repeat protein